jgi:hypothetical protein
MVTEGASVSPSWTVPVSVEGPLLGEQPVKEDSAKIPENAKPTRTVKGARGFFTTILFWLLLARPIRRGPRATMQGRVRSRRAAPTSRLLERRPRVRRAARMPRRDRFLEMVTGFRSTFGD